MFRKEWFAGSRDGISFCTKYPLISEYLAQNYYPLCQIGSYVVWAQNQNWDMLSEKSTAQGYPIYSLESSHHSFLNLLPYVMGEFSEAEYPQTISLQSDELFWDAVQTVSFTNNLVSQKSETYLIFTVQAPVDTSSTITFNGKKHTISYSLTLKEGDYQYAIRVSSDYLWFFDEYSEIKFSNTGNMPLVLKAVSLC